MLLRRHPSNPILTAAAWPYAVHSVFNAGATRLANGTTLLLCRAEDRRGHSHLSAARSSNGVDGWIIDPQPTFPADPGRPEEGWGVEDPRITFVPELGRYVIAYTAFGRGGPGVSLALTEDFRTFERLGLALHPDDKDAALLPRRVDGNFVLLHRPIAQNGRGDICVSFSTDLRNWGGRRTVLRARRGGWWDANKIGLSPPPIETPRGWLILYHGVRQTAAGCIYRLGVALLDLDRPEQCLLRGDAWIFGPEASYEREGDVANVTFPCGYTLDADGDTLKVYYGAADTSIALATGSVRQLLSWLDEHGAPPVDTD